MADNTDKKCGKVTATILRDSKGNATAELDMNDVTKDTIKKFENRSCDVTRDVANVSEELIGNVLQKSMEKVGENVVKNNPGDNTDSITTKGGRKSRRRKGKRGGRKSKRRSGKKARKSKKSKRRRSKKSKRRRRRK